MLKAFDGITDEINYDGQEIQISGKSFTFPKTDINASRIDYDNKKIGNNSVPAGNTIDKVNHNKYLPVPFGSHWCAPMQPVYIDNVYQKTYYSVFDENYSPLLSNTLKVRTDLYNYNIGSQGSKILLENDDYFTPLHLQGWKGDYEVTYNFHFNDGTINGIALTGVGSGAHKRTDDAIFVTVPLRYHVRNDLANWFLYSGGPGYDDTTTIEKIFSPADNTAYSVKTDMFNNLQVWIKATLDVQKNLCEDEKSFIRKGRKISIPSTSSNNGGQGYLLGEFYISGQANSGYPITMCHWKSNYVPDVPSAGLTDYRFIAKGNMGFGPGAYLTTKYGARVFNKNSLYYNWIYDIFNTLPNDLGLQGSVGLSSDGSQGLDPFIIRETLIEPVGAALNINLPADDLNDNGEVDIWKIFHLTAGEIDLAKDAKVFAAAFGAKLLTGNSLKSTPQNTSSYMMQRPYEYIEFLLKDKTPNAAFSGDFDYASINGKWSNFFSTSRDGSGFVIDNALTLDTFMADYLKTEPFTVYAAEDGSFQFKMLRKTYSESDTQGVLDYNDTNDFNITMTPSKNIVAEIKSLKTDYMYSLDSYVSDINWRILPADYNYSFWKYGNTPDINEFKIDAIEKKYTSYNQVDTIVYNGKHYGCVRTNTNQIPAADSLYWRELNEQTAVNIWSASIKYFGEDAEQHEIASWHLNQWGNKHRIVSFSTDNLSYLKFNVGDIVEFTNVPFSLVGMDIKGFNGATNFESTVNGQIVYAGFIITNIQKSLKKVSIEAMQLHNLSAYQIERVN
jgi:hypothetical protein